MAVDVRGRFVVLLSLVMCKMKDDMIRSGLCVDSGLGV